MILLIVSACAVKTKEIGNIISEAVDKVSSPSDSINTASQDSLTRDIKKDSIKDSLSLIDSISSLDSLQDSTANLDSLIKDSIDNKNYFVDNFEDIIAYKATDSIIMDGNNITSLYGNSSVDYQNKSIDAGYLQMNMDSNLVYAKSVMDSTGENITKPKFRDGGEQYEASSMKYNFKTSKGFITGVTTQQGEGFVTAQKTKKNSVGCMYMQGGRYTTCDHTDHPHFYLALTKAKVKPNENIVAGPSYLVIEDVPLPIGLPFGYFPFSSSYQSGIIMPKYGEESNRGLYLRDGGYYFAFNDYIDLAVTGDIYSRGSWGVNARSNYNKRYKFNGGFNIGYIVTQGGYEDVRGTYSKNKDFSFTWTHTQDAKASPNSTFSASVNFSTSSYNHNSLENLYNPIVAGQNTKSSSINYSHNFAGTPWSISGGMDITQTSVDSTISVNLPNFTWNMSRIYPFKRSKRTGPERWYEKISLSYTGQLRNFITTKDSLILKSNLIKDWSNGINHSIPISASYKMFDYIDFTMSANYNERWYSYKTIKSYDPVEKKEVDKKEFGFNRVYNFGASASMSTTLYGFFKPLKSLFGDKIDMIRHRLTPRLGVSYTPDFGDDFWGYYRNLEYTDANGREVSRKYNLYQNNIFGSPGQGLQANINFGMDNNLEAKIKEETDSVPTFKKLSLIESFSWSGSYNVAADSFKLSDISTSLNIKLPGDISLNLSGSWDMYQYTHRTNADGSITPIRIDKIRLLGGKGFGSLRGTGTSFSYNFNNESIKKIWKTITFQNDDDNKKDSEEKKDENKSERMDNMNDSSNNLESMSGSDDDDIKYDRNGYAETSIPWNLSVNYSINMYRDQYKPEKDSWSYKFNHSLMFSGSIQPTKNWRINFNSSYDFEAKKLANLTIGITRDMHCWSLTASAIPVGPYKSYSVTIGVKSSLLQDLKWDKHNSARPEVWY